MIQRHPTPPNVQMEVVVLYLTVVECVMMLLYCTAATYYYVNSREIIKVKSALTFALDHLSLSGGRMGYHLLLYGTVRIFLIVTLSYGSYGTEIQYLATVVW